MILAYMLIISAISARVETITAKTVSNSVTKKELQKKYIRWLDKHGYEHENDNNNDYTKINIEYVDVDGNGITEMIYSRFYLGHVVLTYDKNKKCIIKLKEMSTGKGGYAYYNKKKGMVSLSVSSTGDEITYFYKLVSNKLRKVKEFKFFRVDKPMGNSYKRTWRYTIDGKQVNKKQYNKSLKFALRGYKKVTPMKE